MLRNYIKLAIKVLLRRKFFTFVSLFGIGFTLIVLMLATAMLDHTFGAHPPEGKLDRTVGVYAVTMRGEQGARQGTAGFRFAERYMKDLPGVETMTLIGSHQQVGVEQGGKHSRAYLKRTDAEFWKVYNPKFIEGRPFTSDESARAATVAVINEATRTRYFGSEKAEGRFLEVDGQRFRVVGVVENVSFLRLTPFSDIWVPISTSRAEGYKQELVGQFFAIIVAKNRSDFPAMREELDRRLISIPTGDKEFPTIRAVLGTPFETLATQMLSMDGDVKSAVRILQAIMLLSALMFISLPTLNLVNVNLSRILERSSEIGVRKAFGASSRTLIGQFVVENVVLTLIGGIVGLIGSLIILQIIDLSGTIPYSDLSINFRIFVYALAIALFFGVFSGVYPAWRMSRLHPVDALRGGNR